MPLVSYTSSRSVHKLHLSALLHRVVLFFSFAAHWRDVDERLGIDNHVVAAHGRGVQARTHERHAAYITADNA